MQNTIAQHQQRTEKPGTFSSTARANRTGIGGKATMPAPVAQAPTFLRSRTSYPKKHDDVTVPIRFAKNDLQKAMELQRAPLKHIALMHQFKSAKYYLELDLYFYLHSTSTQVSANATPPL